MRKVRIAERILSQVLTRERAASAVGDWVEDIGERGSAWFWSCVLRTAISRVWSDLTESPPQMAGLAFRACLRLWVFLITYCLVLSVVLLIGMLVVGAIRYGLKLPALSYPDPRGNPLAVGLLWAFVSFRAGQWIAQRAPGREVAASVALWLMQEAVAILLMIGAIVVFHFDRAAFTPADLVPFSASMSTRAGRHRRWVPILILAHHPLCRQPIPQGVVPVAREWWAELSGSEGELFCAPERS